MVSKCGVWFIDKYHSVFSHVPLAFLQCVCLWPSVNHSLFQFFYLNYDPDRYIDNIPHSFIFHKAFLYTVYSSFALKTSFPLFSSECINIYQMNLPRYFLKHGQWLSDDVVHFPNFYKSLNIRNQKSSIWALIPICWPPRHYIFFRNDFFHTISSFLSFYALVLFHKRRPLSFFIPSYQAGTPYISCEWKNYTWV